MLGDHQRVRVPHEREGLGRAGRVGAGEVPGRRQVQICRDEQDDTLRRREEDLRRHDAGDEHRVHVHREVRAGVRLEAQGRGRGQGRHRPRHGLQARPSLRLPHAESERN